MLNVIILSVFVLIIVMLNAIMLSVVILNVVILRVVAPKVRLLVHEQFAISRYSCHNYVREPKAAPALTY